MPRDLYGQPYLSDGEIMNFFRCGENRQMQLTRNITVLCNLMKSNKDIILSNTYNPYGDGVRFRDVESILAKTKADTKERLKEFEREYRNLRKEIDRLNIIRQSVFRLEVEDYELLRYLYSEGKPWHMAVNKFHLSRSSIANHRKRSFVQIRAYFEDACKKALGDVQRLDAAYQEGEHIEKSNPKN